MTEPEAQELWITLCRLIVSCGLTADAGLVWRTRQDCDIDDLEFILGIGGGVYPQIYYRLPENRWEECYFAKEMGAPIEAETISPEAMRVRLAELLTVA